MSLKHAKLALLATLSGCSSLGSQHAVNIAQAHGFAAVMEFIQDNPNDQDLPVIDVSKYFVEQIEDPSNRRYIFVGFPTTSPKGYVAIFESCPGSITRFSLSSVGLSNDLQKERKGFLAAADNPGTDYPSPCSSE